MATKTCDVVIAGAGPAGLSAALVLGRARRTVLVCDTGTPRSWASKEMHGFAESLGCRFTRHGGTKSGQFEATSVPGVFVAGNIIKDVQLAIVAAAEGTRAAFGINRALTREDFERKATGVKRIGHPAVEDPDMERRRARHG
jgi:thioredoxin reductase